MIIGCIASGIERGWTWKDGLEEACMYAVEKKDISCSGGSRKFEKGRGSPTISVCESLAIT